MISKEEMKQRTDLIIDLGDELGKSVYKMITQNEKYTQYDFNYFEEKFIIDRMYAKIYELIHKDQNGEKNVQNS